MEKPKYLWKSALKERGWTDGAIKKFLGKPDDTARNPHSRNKPPVLLWRESKVLEAEASEAFIQWKESTQARREASSKRMKEFMEVKRQQTIETFTEAIEKSTRQALEGYSPEQLEGQAIRHWAENKNAHYEARGEYEKTAIVPRRADLDEFTLRRWVENFVRHELTDYEYLLAQSKGAIGREDAYQAMKEAVSSEVSAFYSRHAAQKQEQEAS